MVIFYRKRLHSMTPSHLCTVHCRFQFWAKEGKAVMFMNEAQIKAQESKDFRERQAKRARAKVRRGWPQLYDFLSWLQII